MYIYNDRHLKNLESESIYILREAVAESELPVMLYSIGKDSSVMVHLAKKAFAPGKIPFPLLHIDSLWKFREMILFRDKFCTDNNLELKIHFNVEGKNNNVNPFTYGSRKYTDIMKTQALLQALNQGKYDIIFCGARRDEEKSRAKERVFSFRDKFHQWNPKKQRPELWSLFNCNLNVGESVRVFPLSNWTEIDIWKYIKIEKIPIVPLYFAKKRPVIEREGRLIMIDDERISLRKNEKIFNEMIRFRTLGCYPLTGAIRSAASNLDEIIEELYLSEYSERNNRIIDFDAMSSMEEKKRQGYF